MTQVLAGRRALVTGAGSGLGRAISFAFHEAGARVAVLDLNAEGAAETVEAIVRKGGEAIALVGSVAEAEDVSRAFDELDRQWNGLDVLVNNAGINMNRPSLELDPKDWRRALSINLDGTFYCAREAATRMQAQNDGAIVNISSIYGLVAAPNRAAYCSSKSAVAMLTKSLAVEWAELGIRVNGICPGYSVTPALETLAREGRVDLEALKKRTPQNRLATPEEIADAVLYLAEPRSAHVTGQLLAVDGGWTAYGYI